jgi:hypothetical protein
MCAQPTPKNHTNTPNHDGVLMLSTPLHFAQQPPRSSRAFSKAGEGGGRR